MSKKPTGHRTHPRTIGELLERAERAGLVVERGTRHWKVRDPHTTRFTTVVTKMGDWRTLRNSVMQIRRDLGVDLKREAD